MKQEIAQIRAAYDQEDNKIPVGIESSLKEIEKSYDDLQVQITEAEEKNTKQVEGYGKLFKESKKRQTRILELEQEMDTVKDDKEKILKDTKHEDYDELKSYKAKHEKKIEDENKIIRKQFIERHKDLLDHDDYDKAKGGFILPDEPKEKGSDYNWSKISDADVVANMQKLKEYEGLGLLGGVTTEQIRVNTEKAGRTKTVKDEFSIFDDK